MELHISWGSVEALLPVPVDPGIWAEVPLSATCQ